VRSDLYSNHINTHFRNKPFACSECPKKFYTRTLRDNHLEALHEKDLNKYNCDHCNFKTYSIGNMKYHMKKHAKSRR
jgi:truncated hemoglobin YjbI